MTEKVRDDGIWAIRLLLWFDSSFAAVVLIGGGVGLEVVLTLLASLFFFKLSRPLFGSFPKGFHILEAKPVGGAA